MKTVNLLALSLAVWAQPSAAAEISILDFDKDGRISRLELLAGVEFWANQAKHRTLLRDLAAEPPASEKAAKISADTREIHYVSFLKRHQLKDSAFHPPGSIAPAWLDLENAELRPAPKQDTTSRYIRMKNSPALRLRRDKDDLSAAPADRKGALVSFHHNFTSDDDQWLARGIFSVGGVWELNEAWYNSLSGEEKGSQDPFWSNFGLHGNALIDRVAGEGGPEAETDILEFSFSGQGLTKPILGDVALLADVALVDSTNFDFNRHLAGGTFELELVSRSLMLHSFKSTPAGDFTAQFKVRAEAGTLVSGEDDPASHADDDFLRIGPSASLSYFPAFVPERRLKLYAQGSYLAAIQGGEDSKLFVAGAAYTLPFTLLKGEKEGSDLDGRLSLNIEYRNGELPFSAQRDESLVIGLGILF